VDSKPEPEGHPAEVPPDPAPVTEADQLEDEVRRLKDVYVPSCLGMIAGENTGISARGCRTYLKRLHAQCENPNDRGEVLLCEQLELLHFARAGILARTIHAEGRAFDLGMAHSAKFSSEIRKTVCDLAAYRASRAARQQPKKARPQAKPPKKRRHAVTK
jgi:hypothetical protein